MGANAKPEWILKGFTKVRLKPSKPRIVSFVLSLRDLSYWDDSPGMSKWVCATGEFRACVGANARDAVVPGKAACVRFTPQCKKLVEIIAKDEDVDVHFAAAAPASHFGLVLISVLMVLGFSAAAFTRTSYRRRHRANDGFEIVASSTLSVDDLHLCESSPDRRRAEEEGLL